MFDGPLAAEIGSTVSNTATISYTLGATTLNSSTAPADFIVEPRRTSSTIEFLRFAPSAPDAQFVSINGSDYASSFSPGGVPVFSSSGPPVEFGMAPIDLSGPLPLTPADNYFSGELIFVRVSDPGFNGDSASIERLVATITSAAGDEVTLQLYETGPDTGVFAAYVETGETPSAPTDNLLTVASSIKLTASYVDSFDAGDVSIDIAGVDPYGRVFDSATGELIDGAQITVIDASTGAPASVMGVDGVSPYPSTIMSGEPVADASGRNYNLEPGEFLFPIMFPGEYQLAVVPPTTYSAPSNVSALGLTGLPNGPFTIMDASYLRRFTVSGSGDIVFDVPLDPGREIVVTKAVSSDVASIGDFVRYDVTIENRGDAPAALQLVDLPGSGLRYQSGSAHRDGDLLEDPQTDAAASQLQFDIGSLAAGASTTVSYVMEIAAGAKTGLVLNRAYAASASGAALSNTGEAAVLVRDDFLREKLTIVGRVTVSDCAGNAAGEGLEGVRLYMETGAYTSSDEDGLYHFENVDPKTHVVQLDAASLPEGYAPVACKKNTRFAGSATSQFVDAQGGALWRADFYVRRENSQSAAPEREAAAAEAAVNDAKAYLKFNKSWLNTQSAEAEWVYPDPSQTPSARAVNIGVKHAASDRAELYLNGAKVAAENFAGRNVGLARTAAITRWRGVDLVDGENLFEAVIVDPVGAEKRRIRQTVTFVTDIARADLIKERSSLVADGATPPAIAVRLTDGAGRPVHPGRIVSVNIDPPYRLNGLAGLEDLAPLTAPLAARGAVTVGADGVALIELEPTLQTGKVRVDVEMSDGRRREIFAQLTPALRDWIVVGLAEGGLARERRAAPSQPSARDLLRDGRIAVFAKGAAGENWLITAAVDTDNGRGDEDDELFDDIDPDARYSIFGDRSTQQFEAQSRYPVYVKAENGGFRAVFGDFDTGLNETSLGKYARRLSGGQVVYEGEKFRFNGFAADTNQRFLREELAADGTSGPFRLTGAPLVRNSERLTIEARSRLRPDEVTRVTPLVRYQDYDIDFETGELLFRLPIAATDGPESFNVIVAEFETSAPVERNLVTGGRGAFRFAGGRVEAGATIIREEGLPDAVDGSTSLAAADLRADITDTTQLRLEYGESRRREDDESTGASAIKAELQHNSARVNARAFFDRISGVFGFGQQSTAASGVQRAGAEAQVLLSESHSEKSGDKRQRFIEASVTEERNLATGARRDIEEAGLRQESDGLSALMTVKRVAERTADGVKRNVVLLRAEVKQHFDKLGLTLRASREEPVSGENSSVLYPKRTRLGFDQRITERLTLNVDHEIQKSDAFSASNTIVGLTAEPWAGARLKMSADRLSQDTGQRLGATLGVDQQIRIDDHWSASLGVSRRQQLGASGAVVRTVDDITPDLPQSPLESDEDFTSVFIGAGYRDAASQVSARFEARKGDISDRYAVILSGAREVSEELSFAGAARFQKEYREDADTRNHIDVRLATAWRPRGDGLIILDRFDIKQSNAGGNFESWKAVNNLVLNAEIVERLQVSLQHGFKYAELSSYDENYSGVTQLFGAETRYDLNEYIDVGFRGSLLYSHNAGAYEYAYGPSIGVNPIDNVWFSFGWNFAGYRDEDFLGAEFSRKGPYLQLRIKFDQNTADALLSGIGAAN